MKEKKKKKKQPAVVCKRECKECQYTNQLPPKASKDANEIAYFYGSKSSSGSEADTLNTKPETGLGKTKTYSPLSVCMPRGQQWLVYKTLRTNSTRL